MWTTTPPSDPGWYAWLPDADVRMGVVVAFVKQEAGGLVFDHSGGFLIDPTLDGDLWLKLPAGWTLDTDDEAAVNWIQADIERHFRAILARLREKKAPYRWVPREQVRERPRLRAPRPLPPIEVDED